MAIQDDFTIFPDSKVIRHTSGTTVYTMTQFHSYLMNTCDEPGYLSYETPIKFNTPTSFTMINGWFLDDGDGSDALQFLTAGGLDTLGYATVSDPIWMMDLDRTTGANFVAADKDKIIKNTDDAANIGPLLTFKVGYPSGNLTRMWVRNTLSATIPDAADGIEAVTGGGTGNYTDNTLGPAIVGDEIYHNVFTIATFAGTPDPQVYMYQNHPVSGTRTRIAEWSNLTNWDRGTIDVLIPVQLGGALIDSGNVTTFVRQTGDSYTLVVSTFNAAGRTGIATETVADTVNITKGEHYLFYDSVSNPGYSAGTVIQDVATGGASPPTWYAEIVAHTNWTASSGYI
ncbi:hypothetical protein KA005_06395, partial [bacterium]|nr:hypothetical protein [bacterium]